MPLPACLGERFEAIETLPAIGSLEQYLVMAHHLRTVQRLFVLPWEGQAGARGRLLRLAEQSQDMRRALHPHLSATVEADVAEDCFWVTEEAAGQEPLAAFLRGGADTAACLRALLDVWECLAYLHLGGFTHQGLCSGMLWARQGRGVIGGLGGPGAVAAQMGSAVLDTTPVRRHEADGKPLSPRQQDVRDLAGALLTMVAWPPAVQEILQEAALLPGRAERIAARLAEILAALPQGSRMRSASRLDNRVYPPPPGAAERQPLGCVGFSLGLFGVTLRGLLGTATAILVIIGLFASSVLLVLGPTGQTATMPKLAGMPLKDAERRAAQAGLKLTVAYRDWNQSIPEGSVISTTPYEGKLVRAGREVRATISSGPREVKVPTFSGLDLAAVTKKLQALDLLQGELVYQQDDKSAGTILEQTPAPGEIVGRKAKIDLVLSGGPDFGTTTSVDGRKFLFRTVSITVPEGKPLQMVNVEVRANGENQSFFERLCRPGEQLSIDVYGPQGARLRVKIEDERAYSERL